MASPGKPEQERARVRRGAGRRQAAEGEAEAAAAGAGAARRRRPRRAERRRGPASSRGRGSRRRTAPRGAPSGQPPASLPAAAGRRRPPCRGQPRRAPGGALSASGATWAAWATGVAFNGGSALGRAARPVPSRAGRCGEETTAAAAQLVAEKEGFSPPASFPPPSAPARPWLPGGRERSARRLPAPAQDGAAARHDGRRRARGPGPSRPRSAAVPPPPPAGGRERGGWSAPPSAGPPGAQRGSARPEQTLRAEPGIILGPPRAPPLPAAGHGAAAVGLPASPPHRAAPLCNPLPAPGEAARGDGPGEGAKAAIDSIDRAAGRLQGLRWTPRGARTLRGGGPGGGGAGPYRLLRAAGTAPPRRPLRGARPGRSPPGFFDQSEMSLQEGSHLQALIPLEVCNHPDICWKSSTASCKLSRRLLDCVEDTIFIQELLNE
ncbi:collagen alpha-1(I) chain-like [Falco naumanni]|uniref:collagen alpha-1(I) chain-like n=1 Tax=Falco naumanni TaxID=148594 RepID=UPI001ADE0BA9|nr:collagen alpha-1(I) chain-like [Falco naumanni]